MGKVFSSEPELENLIVFAVKRLIYDYTPTHYDEPVSTYTKKVLNDQIQEDLVNNLKYRGSLGIPKHSKYLNYI